MLGNSAKGSFIHLQSQLFLVFISVSVYMVWRTLWLSLSLVVILCFSQTTQSKHFFFTIVFNSLLEKKYSEQIRGLQQELQRERESMDRQSLHLRQDIAKELSSAQEQSSQLRQKIETLEQVLTAIDCY